MRIYLTYCWKVPLYYLELAGWLILVSRANLLNQETRSLILANIKHLPSAEAMREIFGRKLLTESTVETLIKSIAQLSSVFSSEEFEDLIYQQPEIIHHLLDAYADLKLSSEIRNSYAAFFQNCSDRTNSSENTFLQKIDQKISELCSSSFSCDTFKELPFHAIQWSLLQSLYPLI